MGLLFLSPPISPESSFKSHVGARRSSPLKCSAVNDSQSAEKTLSNRRPQTTGQIIDILSRRFTALKDDDSSVSAVYKSEIIGAPAIVVNNYEPINAVFKSVEFSSVTAYPQLVAEMMGETAMVFVDGDMNKKRRKSVATAFLPTLLSSFTSLFDHRLK